MEIQKISRIVNGTTVEQRTTDGFINGTAMCVAHGKRMNNWLQTDEALELFLALADDLGMEINCENSSNSNRASLSASKYCEMFPGLIISKVGSPENGGGTWIHPDLTVQLAQWCNPRFAIQVSRWVLEWMTTGVVQPPTPSPLSEDGQRLEMIQKSIDIMKSQLGGLDDHSISVFKRSILEVATGGQTKAPGASKANWKETKSNQPVKTKKVKLSVVKGPQELTGKARLAIRNYLLEHRGTKFTNIDLAKALDLSLHTIRKEMPLLVRQGFVECDLNPEFTHGHGVSGVPKYYYLIPGEKMNHHEST